MPPTTLIGRDAEVATVLRLFDDGARLVTLTGPGGTGKTRLALEIAAEALDRYPDGVFVVDLSPLTEPALVVPTIATTLGVRESAGQALLDTLIGFLVPKRLLLILDNCEQVLDAAPDVAALLASAPHLAILTTSREPLHVRGEREFPLLPLLLPAADRLPAIEDVARTPAVALFVERATASQPDFALTAANVSAVAAICRQLDGLPLAIELAAARVKVLPPAALLSRLEKRLPMLTGGSRDLPARQRTMRDAIAWSYDLLSPEEQTLFRRLSVCVGTFSLAAAEAMAGPDNDLSIVDGIGALIEQSLLLQAPGLGAEPRYLMLEIMREFGLEMLAVASETEGSRERHARYFLGPDDAQVPFAPVIQAPENTALLAAERDNVRVAFVWLDERGEIDALLSRTMLLYRLWFTPGLHHEGQQWIERALERASTAAPLTRFRALDTALTLADHGGDYARAAGYAAEGLALARELGDPLLTGEALTNAGILAYRQGEYGQAEELLLEALGLLREGADRSSDGIALLSLGDTTLAQERFDEAAAWYEESLEAFETTGYPWGLSDTRAGLGAVNVCLGNLKRAAALYSDSLARAQNHGFTMLVISSLLGLAAIAATSGQPETGARLLGAAEETAARLGAPTFPRDNPVRDRALATLTATLDEHQLAAARESGQALALEAAVAEAQSVAERLERSPP